MKLIAIDPGNAQSAFVVLGQSDSGIAVIGHQIVPNDDMLSIIDDPVRMCGASFCDIDALAIEMVASFGMAVGKEVFETVWWTGRFCQAWRGDFHRVYRMQVKMHLCHNSRAKDPNIRAALIDKLGPAGTKKEPGPTYGISKDVWSALAVGITFLETQGVPA